MKDAVIQPSKGFVRVVTTKRSGLRISRPPIGLVARLDSYLGACEGLPRLGSCVVYSLYSHALGGSRWCPAISIG